MTTPGTAGDLEVTARACREKVARMLGYWRRTTRDRRYGGYRVRDHGAHRLARLHRWRARHGAPKHVVAQCRLVFTFAHAAARGWADPSGADVDAARRGYEFLVRHLWDGTAGGWMWQATRDGTVIDDRKNLYAQVAAVHALVEYARASGDDAARQRALDTFAAVQARFSDRVHGGWHENFARDWEHLVEGRVAMVGRVGVKSANVTLHVMEALTDLAEDTGEPEVLRALADAVDVMRTRFYPDDPGQWAAFRLPDWSPVPEPAAREHSYGHAVEHAWLSIRAEGVAGRALSWNYFHGLVDHVLRSGYDRVHGGLFNSGPPGVPATDTTKEWWAQAELVAALVDADLHRPSCGYAELLAQTLAFVDDHLADPDDGMWREASDARGTIVRPRKAHDWVSGYHDVRALVKFGDAYGARGLVSDP